MSFFGSTIGKKVIVAVTGLILLGFVVGHLAGNLQIFAGPKKLNDYADFLHNAKALLWGTRIGLLGSVALHIVATIQLTRRNRASRPVKYAAHEMVQASLPSRFMIWSGIFLFFYIIYHIMHFTLGVPHPNFDAHDIYANVVIGFSQWPVVVVYTLAMISLGFHLYHGIASVFQTLGFNHPRYNGARRALAIGAAWLISLGYISIPAGVLFGVISL
jgi:succinate dehydrogenase / fumarate reductase, cytochrome b subunit